MAETEAAPASGESRRQQLLPRPKAITPAADSTLSPPWTCLPEKVIGPDLQEMRNIHLRLKPTPWIASD